MNSRITETGANKVFFAVVVLNLVYFLGIKVVDRYCFGFLSDNNYLILIINQFYFILFPVLLYLIVKNRHKGNIENQQISCFAGSFNSFDFHTCVYGGFVTNVMIVYILQSTGYILGESLPVPQNFGDIIYQSL